MEETIGDNSTYSQSALDAWNRASIVCVVENKRVSFRGLWYGDNPFNFIFPTIVAKIVLVTVISRLLHWLLKPFRQPKFVCYVLGGMMLGPSLLGRNPKVWEKLFPPRENELLQTLAIIGGIYSVFIIGVKMDNSLIVRSAKNSWKIGFAGFIAPAISATALIFTLLGHFPGVLLGGPFIFYLPLSLSYTFFPVLAHALEELDLLNSELGQLAMSSAILNDLIFWFFLALSIALKQEKMSHSIQALFSFMTLVLFSFTLVRRYVLGVAKKTPEGKPVDEYYTVVILVGVMLMAFISSFIGATSILGPLLLGFVIPGGPPLGSALVQKTEAMVSEFLMPMFFVQVGYSVDINTITNWPVFMRFQIIISLAYLVKFLGTLMASMTCKISFKSSAALGMVMNIKGILELIHFHRWKSSRYVDDQTYTQLVLSTVGVTMVVTPLVSILCSRQARLDPSHAVRGLRTLRSMGRNTEFRIMCCIHSEENVHGMITLLEASNPTPASPICAYIVQTSELVGLAAPLLVPYDKRRRRLKLSSFSASTEQVIRAFENYSKNSRGPVVIMPFLMVASYRTMHESVCRLSQDKFIPLVVVPFQCGGGRFSGGPVAASLRQFNASVLGSAPCTVGILVDRGLSGLAGRAGHVAVVFVGGPDDREALAYAGRMSDHQARQAVTVVRIAMRGPAAEEDEAELDEAAVEEFRVRSAGNGAVAWREVEVEDAAEAMNALRLVQGSFNLVLVGRRRSWSDVAEETMTEFVENEELGVIGDMLASSDFCGGMVSVLVVQHHVRELHRTSSARSTTSTLSR